MRYMPTLRVPVFGSCVMTAGSVMNGAGSPGQQCWIGRRSRFTSSPCKHDLLRGAAADGLRHRVGDRLQLLQALHLLHQPLRRLHLDNGLELRRRVVEALDAESETHPALGPELVDEQRVRRALRVLEEERRPARAHGAVDDLGHLEVGVDLGVDPNELALTLQERDPVAQVSRRTHLAAG